MALSNSGRYEIEAAKSRLALSQKWVQSAQDQLDLAKKEEEDAKAFLQEVEQRLEVVNIDSDGEEDESPTNSNDDGRKRQRNDCSEPATYNTTTTSNNYAPISNTANDSGNYQPLQYRAPQQHPLPPQQQPMMMPNMSNVEFGRMMMQQPYLPPQQQSMYQPPPPPPPPPPSQFQCFCGRC